LLSNPNEESGISGASALGAKLPDSTEEIENAGQKTTRQEKFFIAARRSWQIRKQPRVSRNNLALPVEAELFS
jgi:hypothetical protein